MKKEYVTPVMLMEDFVPNQFIAGCGDTNITGNREFECFNGPDTDGLSNVLADVAGSTCKIKTKYVSATTISKPGYTSGTAGRGLTNEYGFFVICYNENAKTYDTSAWGTGTHANTHSRQNPKWHCMASPVTGETELHNLS